MKKRPRVGETLKLEDLIGLHMLSGCDMYSDRAKSKWIGPEYGDDFRGSRIKAVNFVLDNVAYSALEDSTDGYDPSMQDIRVVRDAVKNLFPPQEVFCVMRRVGEFCDAHILDCYNATTGGPVLSIGTDYYDHYYPIFVVEFYPENMAINAVRDLRAVDEEKSLLQQAIDAQRAGDFAAWYDNLTPEKRGAFLDELRAGLDGVAEALSGFVGTMQTILESLAEVVDGLLEVESEDATII